MFLPDYIPTFAYMSEKDLKVLNEIAHKQRKLVTKMSKADAMKMLVDAGIFRKDGKYAKPYENLERTVTRK